MADGNVTLLLKRVETAETSLKSLKDNADVFFVLIMAIVIFFMQAGFAFLECGSVRSKNTTNILIKNMLDCFISGIAYWGVGYALAFGEPDNFFLGTRYWFSENMPGDMHFHFWFFHFVFAATAATIVSGAMAERCEFIAYFAYSFVITGVVYPIVTHWAWSSSGWLAVGIDGIAYKDFAGSGVVHLLGGTAALVGAILLGPRIGRFDSIDGKPNDIPGHSVPLAALGGFILMFGFFAFNGGSQASISQPGDGAAVARAMMNTVICGSFAAFTSMILKKCGLACINCSCGHPSNWSLLVTINGALTGMVAACAGCDVLMPWGACIVGVIAGITYLFWSWAVQAMKIDDPLDAVAVHGGGGLWGLIAVPIFKMNDGIIFDPSNVTAWKSLGVNMVGAVAIVGWTAVICLVLFGILKLCKVLRVNEDIEIKGLDIPKHGEPAYPSEAWGDGWNSGHLTMHGHVAMNSDNLEPVVVPKGYVKSPERYQYHGEMNNGQLTNRAVFIAKQPGQEYDNAAYTHENTHF
ncbi:putative ammonium transporter 1 isoform X2 [Lingula anatina]|uniref:Ammonium transporter n=1 Tax=Lingula anatina TaxID=7574 RepID=A0A1S3H1N0_LINAN|nr:putative ammonium transporter 1 isoform X2 [Lingula anatina]|eukprot:XP_013379842.1 putative ammonium transporter 1 isoform X2 [Lingula anatina]